MYFKAEEIYYVIEFFLFVYVKIATFIFVLNVSFLNNFNNKFTKFMFNIITIILLTIQDINRNRLK